MNSQTGGSLLIGVADNGDVVGLADDYRIADKEKQNRDGYQLFLSNMLNDSLGGECISFYKISFHQINDREICRVQVQPASKPVYHKGQFYVRNGNQTLLLTTQEAVEYIKHQWG
jgi:predicted HTH transcriptional regulator